MYAFGLLWIIFAQEAWMLVFGYVLAGLAVGADVPASWTLITETAPDRKRGRHAGFAQLLWMMGPVIVLTIAFALSGLGVLGVRIVFAHLLVVRSSHKSRIVDHQSNATHVDARARQRLKRRV